MLLSDSEDLTTISLLAMVVHGGDGGRVKGRNKERKESVCECKGKMTGAKTSENANVR